MERKYINLNTIYPEQELESETYKINYITLTPQDVMYARIKNSENPYLYRGLQSDFNYVRLIKKGDGIMMSDTPMERNTNQNFLNNANGDVLIFGLGIGLIVFPLLQDENIKSITVIELYQDLIDLVEPIIKQHDIHNKVTIKQGNLYETTLTKDEVFDCIYFDIWIDINTDHYEEQKSLCRKFRKNLNKNNPDKFIDCWMKSYYLNEKRKETRENKKYYGYTY